VVKVLTEKLYPGDVLLHALPELAEKFNCLGIMMLGRPQKFGKTHLGEGVITERELADRDISGGELPEPEQGADRDLPNGNAANHELAKTEKDPDAELGKGYDADRELADGDDSPGNAHLPVLVPAKCDMDQWIAVDCYIALPVNACAGQFACRL
jgi:hypothetical protein